VVVVSAFDWTTDKLQQLAYCVHEEPDDREYARLLMSGELRANAALAMVLQCMDCPACSLTGHEAGINTTPQHVDALVRRVHAGYSRSLIERGVVPVIAGFQGYFHNPKLGRNDVSILGRGGSNLTAVALAHAMWTASTTKIRGATLMRASCRKSRRLTCWNGTRSLRSSRKRPCSSLSTDE
jgi:aspartate kinase